MITNPLSELERHWTRAGIDALARRNASIAEIQRLHGLLKVERKNLVDAEVAMREADDFIARAARVNKQIGGLQ